MDSKHWNDLGQAAMADDKLKDAIGLFQKAIECDPKWSVPHYNMGLCHKFEKQWQASLRANAIAHELDPNDDAAYWNLAIAAVALSDWNMAKKAFTAIGVTVPDGTGPWDFNLGLIPIRVSPHQDPEVVWCHRLDPVRTKIASIPYPESGRRFGDIILNDAEPKGYRQYNGREVPVFNELELLEASSFHTFALRVVSEEPKAVEQLVSMLDESGLEAENWTDSVRLLCRACSEGRPHEEHDEENRSVSGGAKTLGVAAHSAGEINKIVDKWNLGHSLSCELVL